MANLNVSAEEWPTVSRRLDEALALEPGDVDGWLASLPEPASIKATLGRLLAEAGGVETGDFLAGLPMMTLGPGPAPSAGVDEALAPGRTVGPYRLLSELGRGGMGSVWLAERIDGQPKRKVALKLPHIGWAPGLVERLARERDILASLEHPNIARLYDAGADALGRPYLALEYVDGTPIDRHCDAKRLPLRDRLRLVLQVAAAVAYAHTRLVVHRDLKPSNILVAKDGDVRLLDFGIARLMADGESGELTRAGVDALTPDYASPEQLRGSAIGTQSDIYSLGVVAYELLAGSRPYVLQGRRSIAALAEAITTADVPLASRAAAEPALRKRLEGDLDAILNKALKKDLAERYATADAFIDDVERHLRHAPVGARPDTPAYRLRKFVARNTVQVAAGGAVLAAVVAGAGVAVWQAREARDEAARAEQVKEFALSIFNEADTDAGAGAATTAADLLLAAQRRVDRELAGRPAMAVELMTAIGYSLIGQGKLPEAGEIMKRAVELGRRELDPHDRRLLSASVVYGEALFNLGKPKEALALFDPAIDEARRQGAAHELITALRLQGHARINLDDVDGGVASARAAVAVLDSPLAGRLPRLDAFEAWISLSNNLGIARMAGQTDAARQALAIAREVYGERMTAPVLSARRSLASGLAREGHMAEALIELTTLRDEQIRSLGALHPHVEFANHFLGRTQLDAGAYADAADSFRRAVAIQEKQPVGGARGLGIEHLNLAIALVGVRRREEALPHFDRSIRAFAEAGAGSEAYARSARSGRALALTELGRLGEAEREFEALEHEPFTGAAKASHDLRLAVLRSRQQRHDAAVALARAGRDGLGAAPKGAIANADLMLGNILLAAGRPAEAVAPMREAVRLFAEQQLGLSPEHAEAIAGVARAEGAGPASGASAPRR